MKKYILFIVGIFYACTIGCAQASKEIYPLSIGDTVPDIVFHHMLNYEDTTAKLSDFRGKPVILDFFATWCGSCIEALPKLDLLQNKFKNKIQFLVVAYESENKIKDFLKNNSVAKTISLPFITSDSILSDYFPHKLIPHEIWIDRNGVVAAVTGANYLDKKNIRKLISGKLLRLPVKKDAMNFDSQSPLLDNGNGGDRGDILFRSMLTKHLGLYTGGGEVINKDSTQRRIYFTNAGILSLYNAALKYGSNLEEGLGNRVILEVKDISNYIDDGSNKEWDHQNTYCYELIAPIKLSHRQTYQYMKEDLDQYFGLNGKIEKRRTKCWALVNSSGTPELFKSRGGKSMTKRIREGAIEVFQNVPFNQILGGLNYQITGKPLNPIIVDETHYTGGVDIKLEVADFHDIDELQVDLKPYGLKLIPVTRELKMFVLSETKE